MNRVFTCHEDPWVAILNSFILNKPNISSVSLVDQW